ncbi:MAG: RNA polymerase subunit sigma, partial [Clostridia bacterium]|nr:RNA polymerase subunit sigma [Clostridia bacterium]
AYFAWYNRQKRHSATELSEALQYPEDLEETVVRKEMGRQAMEALEELEEPYRTVFALAALEDVPLGEISRRFQKSESWARVIYHRAGKKLAERMKEFL